MYIYIIFIFFIFLFACTNIEYKKELKLNNSRFKIVSSSKKCTLLISVFIISLVVIWGLRDNGGVDDTMYSWYYVKYHKSILSMINNKEPMFLLLTFIGNFLGLNYKVLFLGYSILSVFFIYKGMQNYFVYDQNKKMCALYIVGFYFLVFPAFFTVMRQASAISLLFYYFSIKNPSKKQMIKYSILGVCCHYSFIIVIIIEFIRRIMNRKYSINKNIKIFLPFACILLGYVIDFRGILTFFVNISGLYPYMLSDSNFLSEHNVGIVTIIAFIIYECKLFCKLNYIKRFDIVIGENIEQLQMIFFSLTFLTAYLNWGNRIQLFYIIFTPFLFLDILSVLKTKKLYFFVMYALLMLCIIYVLFINTNMLESVRSVNFIGNI